MTCRAPESEGTWYAGFIDESADLGPRAVPIDGMVECIPTLTCGVEVCGDELIP